MSEGRAPVADMSPDAINARLREVSRLRDERIARAAEVLDMSPEAITRRLRRVSRLRDACLQLRALGQANSL